MPKPEAAILSKTAVRLDYPGAEARSSPPIEKPQNLARKRPGIVDVGRMGRLGNDRAPHIPDRGLQSIQDAVERGRGAFAGQEQRRRADRLGVGARERGALLLDLAEHGAGVVAKHLLS